MSVSFQRFHSQKFLHASKEQYSLYLLACIPAYNEGRIISDLIKKTLKYVNEVVVCDDGSTDNTYAMSAITGAKVIRHEKNMGKGAALRSLFEFAKKSNADIIITIDGDGQFLPQEIPKLVQPIIDDSSDIVIGYRFDKNTEMPSYRKIGNKFLDKATSLASELPFKDTQSGFRAYSKKAIQDIVFSTDGFGVDGEILVNASKKRFRISEEKITVLYDTGEKTSTKNPISHFGEVVTSIIELIALRHPLSYLGIPGLILSITGIGFGIYVLSYFNETRYFSIPYTLISIGTLMIGLMLLLMSVVLYGIIKTSHILKRE